MNKQTFFTWLYVVLIVVTIATMIFIIFWLRGEGLDCIKDPIGYYTSKTTQACFCEDVLRGLRG